MSAPINGAPAALVPPDELAVTEWLKLRLADLRERSDMQSLNVHATWYPHSGEIGVEWVLHAGGQCVVGQPTIAQGVAALRKKLAECAATEALP
jgi:hypothetical protein